MKLHHIHAAPVASRVQFEHRGLEVTWRGDGGTLPLKREMARRLAVCWNVLEGIPTEALERGLLLEAFTAIAAGDLARAQRAAAEIDKAVELTEHGDAHDCDACRRRGNPE